MATTTTHLARAWEFLQQDRPAEARRLSEEVLATEPVNVSALACRAMALHGEQGDNPVSLTEMARAVEMAPDVSALRHNYGTLLSRSGRVDDAAAQYRAALALRPDDTQAFWGLAQNSRIAAVDTVQAMEALYDDVTLPNIRREFLAYGLAKAFDDLGEPERAIRFAIEANRLGARSWNVEGADAVMVRLRELAAADAFRRARSSGHPSRAPLFIVGMPRSGTTLIETILSRHPEVLPLGESAQIVTTLQAAQRLLGTPNDYFPNPQLGRDWLKARSEDLVKAWAGRGKARYSVVTDKMPDNAFALGLIAQLFPKARVIHARRHPLDNGISNFFTRFAKGQPFATRLDWIGTRARHVAEAMEIWKGSVDLPILDVHYEQLVATPEVEIRRMVEFAGLSWDEGLLSPEQSQHNARTASQWQIRQPINTRSVARWRRYEPWLGPMIEAMGGFDWIDAQSGGRDGRT